jgi:hypothetical protein
MKPRVTTLFDNDMSFLIKNGQPQAVPENWVKMKALCPVCKKPLYSVSEPTGSTVWCPWASPTQEDGRHCREAAGHGPSEAKALNVLLAKFGCKDYEVEVCETPESPEDSSSTATPVEGKKKRGRKAKGTIEAFQLPKGEFTMGQFCELNKTYPYKALPFFKQNKVREVGKRPTASGRGKPATLYSL